MASKEIAPPVIRTTVSSAGKMTQAGLTGSLTDLHNTVNLGPLPFPEREDTTCTGYTTKSGQSHRSTRSTKAGSTPTTAGRSDFPDSSLKKPSTPLWHTLPLVPRSPITILCAPFDRRVPWLDRKGSSYDLLREEYNELMDKVGKVYSHIEAVVDSSHETQVYSHSMSNIYSRMSRQGADNLSDYDCYGLDPPEPLKWSRLSRKPEKVFPRPTETWHHGKFLAPVRRIANQQQQTAVTTRENTVSSQKSTGMVRVFSRSKLKRAKGKMRMSVLASVSLQKLKHDTMSSRGSDGILRGITGEAKVDRLTFIIDTNLKSEIAEVRKEAARDLGILYKSKPSFTVIDALKETVYSDQDILVLIEASKSLLSIGVWDTAAIELLLQSIKYGSADLRFSLLETLRNSKNPHHINKQSVQFRVLHTLLLNLIKKGSHIPREAKVQSRKFSLAPTDSMYDLLPKAASELHQKADDMQASRAGLVCAHFLIDDVEVKNCLLHFLWTGEEDLQGWCLDALVTKLGVRTANVVNACLEQMHKAVKWENRASGARLVIQFKSVLEELGLAQRVFEELDVMLYDDCARQVRQTVARTITELGLHAKMLQAVIRKLDDINEDIRAQGVMALSILGIKGKSLLNQLLDILELDSSIFVRIQVMRAVKELNIVDRRVLRLLRERARGSGPMCKEAQIALFALTGESELKE